MSAPFNERKLSGLVIEPKEPKSHKKAENEGFERYHGAMKASGGRLRGSYRKTKKQQKQDKKAQGTKAQESKAQESKRSATATSQGSGASVAPDEAKAIADIEFWTPWMNDDERQKFQQRKQNFAQQHYGLQPASQTKKKPKVSRHAKYEAMLEERRNKQLANGAVDQRPVELKVQKPAPVEPLSFHRPLNEDRLTFVNRDMAEIEELSPVMREAMKAYNHKWHVAKLNSGARVADFSKMARIAMVTGSFPNLKNEDTKDRSEKFIAIRGIPPSKSTYDLKDHASWVDKAVDRSLDRLTTEFKVRLTDTDRKTIVERKRSTTRWFEKPTDDAGDLYQIQRLLIVLFQDAFVLTKENENYRLAAGSLLTILVEMESRCFPVERG